MNLSRARDGLDEISSEEIPKVVRDKFTSFVVEEGADWADATLAVSAGSQRVESSDEDSDLGRRVTPRSYWIRKFETRVIVDQHQ